MKLGMIAMSGVRAASEELNRAGLTMPGVMERGRVIASMPSLSLLTLAALTPADWDIHYHEIADLRSEPELPDGFDLVAIATFSAQVFDAYAVADEYRARGVPVVMGGLHVTVLPDEAAQHADCVVVGEAEPLWPTVLADFIRGELKPRYGPAPRPFDLADAPIPRYDLLDVDKYNRFPLQTSRGCPFRCEFCASSILLREPYAVKPVERVLAELHAIKDVWAHPFIEFADDNSFVNQRHYRALLESLASENVAWFTECDISVAQDDDLLAAMRRAGCRQVLIGLESPTRAGLNGLELRGNWKLDHSAEYEAAIRKIQSYGITVNGCFILGLDGHGPEAFDHVFDFAMRTGLYDVQITVQTPMPGTPLYARLEKAGRILRPGAWETCTLFDVNFEPTDMTPDELQQGIVALAQRLYAPEYQDARRHQFFDQIDPAWRGRAVHVGV